MSLEAAQVCSFLQLNNIHTTMYKIDIMTTDCIVQQTQCSVVT